MVYGYHAHTVTLTRTFICNLPVYSWTLESTVISSVSSPTLEVSMVYTVLLLPSVLLLELALGRKPKINRVPGRGWGRCHI